MLESQDSSLESLESSLEYHALLLVLLDRVVGGSAVDLTNQIKEYLK